MKRALLLSSCLSVLTVNAQYYCNDFDQGCAWGLLPVAIDTAQATLWQIGAPGKNFFQQAYSPVNAIVTDTVDAYPAGNLSRFELKLPMQDFGWWPEFFLHFQQAFNMDSMHAGAYIEISYDTAQTWTNVFQDWMNPPNTEFWENGTTWIQPDTLSNGQIGFTGTSGDAIGGPNWVWSSFCWMQTGIPLPDTLRLRFTFYSDSLAGPGDGWMLDDFQLDVGFIHPVSEFLQADDFVQVAPNPVTDRLYIRFDVDEPQADVHVALFDASGKRVKTLMDGSRPRGMYNLMCPRSELGSLDQRLTLQVRVGTRSRTTSIVLH